MNRAWQGAAHGKRLCPRRSAGRSGWRDLCTRRRDSNQPAPAELLLLEVQALWALLSALPAAIVFTITDVAFVSAVRTVESS